MTRPKVWQAAWNIPDFDERIRLVIAWERESGLRYYEGEPRREKRLHDLFKQLTEKGNKQ